MPTTAEDDGERYETLLQLGRQLNAGLELDETLQRLVEAACSLVKCEASSILLFETESGLLKFVAGPTHQRERLRKLRVPCEASVAGEAFLRGETVIVEDASRDGRIFGVVDQQLFFRTRSIMAVPISYRSQSLGVMEAVNKLGGSPAGFAPEDAKILETLGAYAANAIFNTLLFEDASATYQDLADLEQKKSDFIAIASHELRTPLGLILGHATYLQDSLQDGQFQRHLDAIVKGGMRLKEIIDDLANMESAESGSARLKRRRLALDSVIQEVLRTFEADAAKKRISLRADLPGGEWWIDGDAEKIAIVLENLVRNAIVFTDEGGFVLLRAERLPGYVKVSVIDNGIGIPARDLPHIFERFYQVEAHNTRRHGGLGLGLSVARVMVKLHGGEIWVESMEGKGSNFTFMLPERAPEGKAERSLFERSPTP
jgi:signal transduction histidine kinase